MNKGLKKLIISALFLAIGFVLPFFTGQIQIIGNMLLPMHIPVILCGLVCGGWYGLAVGMILPVMRSLIFTMPPLYPIAIAMSFELATYGFVSGYLYSRSRWQCVKSLYRCLIIAMLSGRAVYGCVKFVLLAARSGSYGFNIFIADVFTQGIPGIILQLVFIPGFMVALHRAKLVPFIKNNKSSERLYEKK